jgi:hypothetical protein
VDADSSIEARRFQPDDLPGVLELLRGVYGEFPRLPIAVEPIEHLRWKLVDNPYPPTADVVAVDGGRIVGSTFRWLEAARLHGRPVRHAGGADVAVLPEYQGQKVYSLIRDMKGVLSAGTYAMQFGHTRSEVVRARQPFRRWVPVKAAPDLMAARPGRLGLGRKRRAATASEVRDIGRFDEETDALFEAFAASVTFVLERDAERMNWRYIDPRAGEFRVRGAYDGGELLGYAITRWGGRRHFLADVVVRPGRDEVCEGLVGDSLASSFEGGAEVVRAWMPATHPYRVALEACGFSAEKAVDLRYRLGTMSEEEGAFLEDPAGWYHYMLGDTDIV